MRAKLKAVKTELILLSAAAVFLCALLGVARHDRMTAERIRTETALPPEEITVTMVDINHAGMDELITLPGIGESLAQRILDDRAANGLYETPEDLMRVSGIGEKKFEELRDHITAEKE